MKKLITLACASLSLFSGCGVSPYPTYGYLPQQMLSPQYQVPQVQGGYLVRENFQPISTQNLNHQPTHVTSQPQSQTLSDNPRTTAGQTTAPRVVTSGIAEEYEMGHILIGLNSVHDLAQAQRILQGAGLKSERWIRGIQTLVVKTQGQDIPQLVHALSLNPLFAFVETNALGVSRYESEKEIQEGFQLKSEAAFNDPEYLAQYALRILDAEKAWAINRGENMIISVIDSGVELEHHDLKNRVVPGYDAYSDDDSQRSGDASALNHLVGAYKHGTHVAGIIAAQPNNGKSIVGIAPEAKVMPVKIFPDIKDFFITNREQHEDSKITTSAILSDALVWSVDHGADIINMSLIMTFESEAIQRAINYALEKNVTIVVSAGNYRQQDNQRNSLASYPGVIGVGATDQENKITDFSNSGDYVSVVAPGKDIVSTIPALLSRGSSQLMSGTSMAAPYVAGVAALLKSKYGDLATPAWIKSRLETTALDLGEPGRDDLYGHGLINAFRALTAPDITTPTE